MPEERLGLDSRRAIALLGLATASRFCLLAKYCSGVRFSPAAQKITLTGYSFLCRGRESNSHAFRHAILSRARLPIPPPRPDSIFCFILTIRPPFVNLIFVVRYE